MPTRLGDGILSRDEHTGAQTLKAAVRTFVHYTGTVVRLRVGAEELVTTAEHPFWVDGRGWVEAAHLHAGDVLSLADGGQATVGSVTSEHVPAPLPVYNVEVADFHTYFVANAGVWVHNCGVTKHGAQRLAERGFTDTLRQQTMRQGTRYVQRDGADVFLHEASPGRYNFVVEGEKGLVTCGKGWSWKSVSTVGRNHGWASPLR